MFNGDTYSVVLSDSVRNMFSFRKNDGGCVFDDYFRSLLWRSDRPFLRLFIFMGFSRSWLKKLIGYEQVRVLYEFTGDVYNNGCIEF